MITGKRLAAVLALTTPIAGVIGGAFAFGVKSTRIPTIEQLNAVAASDQAVHRDDAKRFETIETMLATISAKQDAAAQALAAHESAQRESFAEVKQDIRELRGPLVVHATIPR